MYFNNRRNQQKHLQIYLFFRVHFSAIRKTIFILFSCDILYLQAKDQQIKNLEVKIINVQSDCFRLEEDIDEQFKIHEGKNTI